MERNKGFISWIILILIALGLLKYFLDWSIVDFLQSDQGRETVAYLKGIIDTVWSYISKPLAFIWNEVVWPILRSLTSLGRGSAPAD